ncbi:polysaccharide pyruvyl transferase family protein [Holdemania filiformis]|uniref:polysaccharide pyruvyl transferase family protein n=1 Tax=Holdemania filiformis TaxID=61171 RepID=UPI00242BA866|nr:polysaccharide pyruvyl transferase family protein [Holdemania filiformis]
MEKIVLLEPCISSLNLGDYIIVDSVKRELAFLLNDAFVVEQPTQTPIMHFYQKNDARLVLARQADAKFVCGSNLMWQNMLNPTPQWNFNVFNNENIKDSILVGVGSSTTRDTVNWYTKHAYRNVLSKKYIHSVRDEATKKRLESIGISAINTGCATMWRLDKNHCAQIPKSKSNRVVFTLTDYLKKKELDLKLISILENKYDEVYFWPQGYSDFRYISELGYSNKVKIISPNLEAMKELLKEGNIDYVGTRLHGGIFAMQHFARSIILIIDNRAREMKEHYNIPAIERNDLSRLEKMIDTAWSTNVNIDTDRIKMWKEQFK